jgi:hypothetical protein
MGVADALPEYDVRARHALRVDAAPDVALAAARSVTAREAPLLRLLFRLRGLRASGGRPLWEDMAGEGFTPLDDDTLVAIGRPWTLRGGLRPRSELLGGGFAGFAEPGWAKLAMDFRFEHGELVTETRVLLTDGVARRRFRRYWLVVRPFSGLVRRSWLKAAKRRAEVGAPVSAGPRPRP